MRVTHAPPYPPQWQMKAALTSAEAPLRLRQISQVNLNRPRLAHFRLPLTPTPRLLRVRAPAPPRLSAHPATRALRERHLLLEQRLGECRRGSPGRAGSRAGEVPGRGGAGEGEAVARGVRERARAVRVDRHGE